LEKYWQCLGLYAMPGTVVTFTMPSVLATAGTTVIHIGGWTDVLYKKTTWYRLPEVVRRYSVSGTTTTTIASAYGGLIYVTLPKGLNLGSISVTVTGGSLVSLTTYGVVQCLRRHGRRIVTLFVVNTGTFQTSAAGWPGVGPEERRAVLFWTSW
jgi:hypothetical protein